ncbi:DUF3944 domain-containing protein [Campylobacter concisus]|uniref:DUF3944 domain-containing protein n=1 Tax=Campylobacter concisus TaxID=199 RepID=UPI000CD90B7F|nr:DUF3944 domain-containing protein [Campylobacter concisus]
MAYKFDSDLEFLRQLDSNELNDLVDIIKGKEGDERITQDLTSNDLFKRFYPDHKEYIELIMGELQCFGGNSFANVFRGGGVQYKEILCDVCDKLKVNYSKAQNTQMIEQNMFMKILSDSLEKMNEEELKQVANEFGLNTTDFKPQAITAAMQASILVSGFAMYKIALIVANTIIKILFGRGLGLAANAALTRTIGIFAGPVGWVVTGLWTLADVAGPAYRVTIPAVIQVAFLRQYLINKQNNSENN